MRFSAAGVLTTGLALVAPSAFAAEGELAQADIQKAGDGSDADRPLSCPMGLGA